MDEVVEKVLSSPTRPQFAIVYVGPSFNLSTAHRRISDSLGSRIPVVTSLSDGIIGRDALTNEFKEVQWEEVDDEDIGDPEDKPNSGILLTVGYLPGMKVNLIPLACQEDEVEGLLIDEFVTNIREYTSSITESASPDAIILFTDLRTDMKLVLQKMDYAFSSETIIVGDGGGRLLYRTNWAGRARRQEFMVPAVALLFVKDKNRRHGIRETKFMVALSTGLRPVGPTYKAASVKEKPSEQSTWLSARRAAVNENLDGQTILDNIYHELGQQVRFMALYIGVKKRRKCSVGPKKVRWLTFLEFHEVMGGDEEYLYVNNTGIRTGDSFQFYASDSNAAISSCNVISETFKRLKQEDLSNQQTSHSIPDSSSKPLVFGGFLFCCCGRGEAFFDRKNVDTMPFLENFPSANIAGTFCSGEIKRGRSGIPGQENEESASESCCLHVFSTVYLLWSYNPA